METARDAEVVLSGGRYRSSEVGFDMRVSLMKRLDWFS